MKNVLKVSLLLSLSLSCYCMANENPVIDGVTLGNGATLISTETKYHVKLPEELKKKRNKRGNEVNVTAYANYATGPVSVEGDYHDVTATGHFICYFPNDSDKQNVIRVVVESNMCIENDNCTYIKSNYDLKYGQYIACNSNTFVMQEMREKGYFEDELIVTLKSDHGDDLYDKDTNTVYIY